ncbi:MAG: ABC transporter ATP-binding protein [Crocinitomicaceae bacterium]|nr:ABC transporter ATP-binding protein/permease [Flavobacteriales bacterium]NQZ34567.1 ABC transporter ATP-binding protein [Crocinitomicaceae bacterium]
MEKKAKLNVNVFMRLLSYWKLYKGLFLIAIICTVILGVLGPLRPAILGYVVNEYITKTQDASMLLKWTLIIGGMLIFEGAFQFLSSYFSNLFAQSIIHDLRKQLMAKILTFRMSYFDRTPIGELVTRLVSDLQAITEVFSAGLMSGLGDVLAVTIAILGMFIVDWELALLTLIPIPILLFATRIFARALRKAMKMEREAVNNLNTFVQERLTGMSLVQLFSRQNKEYDSFKEINALHRKSHVKAIWANSIFFPFVELLSSFSVALLIVYCALKVRGFDDGGAESQFGLFIAFTMWIQLLYRPIRQLADKFNIFQRGVVRAERVFEIIDLDDHIQNEGKITECDFDAQIEFNNVSFAYNDEEWVLRDINMKIEPGSTVAFVGATGAGKSSLVGLLGRFYEYQKGEISVGDVHFRDIELSYLRKNIAIVLQDVFLFSDTVEQNITLGDDSITREEVIAAAKAVGAHDFIVKLPQGYDTQVGERGGMISVGQRQLISFIRAFVYNPHILILDEATSSVDNESEEMIQKATAQLTKGRTAIVIAHRLSTIQSADKIVVLEKGRIVEQGTQAELLELNGFYRNLHDMQFSEDRKQKK